MKGFFIALLVVGFFAGVYQLGMAGYGWFEVRGAVEDVATSEIPKMAATPQTTFGGGSERYGKIREDIIKRVHEAGVPVRAEDVTVNAVNNALDVRVSWDAPLVVYQGKPYLEIPLSVSKQYSLAR